MDEQVDQCAICLENFNENNNEKISQLNCNSKHIFHL